MIDDKRYLRHIIQSIEAIEIYVRDGKAAFFDDRKTAKATLRELQELSESTQRLSLSFKENHKDIPWKDISGFRNILVHDYLGINLDRVWNILENDLPSLKEKIQNALNNL